MNNDKSAAKGKVGPTRAKTVLLFVLTLAFSALEAVFDGSPADIVFTVLSSGFCASALIFSGSFLPLLAALPAYLVSFALSGNALGALASLEFVPVSLVLLYSYRKKRSRVSMICRASAALAVFELLMLSLTALSLYGGIGADEIRTVIEGVRTEISDGIFDALSSVPQTSIVISYDAISGGVGYMLMLLPGVFIALYNIAAFLIQKTVLLVGKAVGAKEMIYDDMRAYKISRPAAIVYIGSYLLYVIFFGGVSVTSAVLVNLIIIFTPGLALYGIKDIARRIKERSHAFPVFLVFGMLLLFFTVPVLFFGLASFFGAWAAFRKE